ncbi:MAG TPA: GAF domain-containing protein [Candidatus Methylomirabilis sp.]|nr:GAF domain-containing protein [Candidatus Methylomirabilis sp.]
MNRHLASLRALAESGFDLTGDLSCQAVLQRIIERAVELAGCRYGALVILDGEGQIAEFYTAGIDPPTQAAISHLAAWKGTLGISLREQKILRTGDLPRYPRPPSFSPRHPPMKSFLGIPVSVQGQLLGELYLAEKQGDRWFSTEDEAFVSALARQAALAIKNARLYAEAQEGVRQAQAAALQLKRLSASATQITSQPDLVQDLDRLAAIMGEACGTPRCAILLVDGERQGTVRTAVVGLQPESVEVITSLPLGPTAGCFGTAEHPNDLVIIEDTHTDPLTMPHVDRLEAFGLRAIWSVPMRSREGRVLATFMAFASEPARPGHEQVEVTTVYARHIAIAIEGVHLFQRMESTNRSLTALNRVAQTVNQSLDLQEILDAVLDATLKAVGVKGGNMRLWDEREGALTIAAHRGMSAGYVDRMRYLRPGEGVSGKVFQRREVFLVEDLRQYPHLNDIAQKEGVRSVASIPIRSREKVVGVMSILSHGQRQFTPAEIDLLTAIGNQIGTAIENARLYQEVRLAALELEAKVEERTRDLESLNTRLEEALRVAQEASRHKSVFLANMSHELRTPLNAIIGFSELLEDLHFGSLNERQQRYVGNVLSSGRHLLALINDVLDISKVEAGKIEVQPEVFAIGPALEAAIREVRSQAIRRGVRMELEIEEGLATLVADPLRFKQILYNLFSNAVKFTDPGGGIRVSARVVNGSGFTVHGERPDQPEPSAMIHERNGDFVEIAVSDTGIGIRAEDIPKLFQPFTQVDASLARRYQGTGLGLALTKRLVELHGGQIWAESEGEGKGSTFTFTLPLRGQLTA